MAAAKHRAWDGVAAAGVAGEEVKAWDRDEVTAEVLEEARGLCPWLVLRHQ